MSVHLFAHVVCPLFQIFVLTVWYWEFYMLPLFLVILLIWNYSQVASEKSSQEIVSTSVKSMTGKFTTHTDQALAS